jgi:glycine cleavage system regulatory protein
MQHSLVFTFICNDKPGIVDQLSKLVAEHKGNWQESRMAKLAGKFTGIVHVSVDAAALPALKSRLLALANHEFSILVDEMIHTAAPVKLQQIRLTILGLDRPGILQEVAKALAQKSINVTRMNTVIESAPMSGDALFKADVEVEAPLHIDMDQLNEHMETICGQLDLDLQLSKNFQRG